MISAFTDSSTLVMENVVASGGGRALPRERRGGGTTTSGSLAVTGSGSGNVLTEAAVSTSASDLAPHV
jgi:hypothetical protein